MTANRRLRLLVAPLLAAWVLAAACASKPFDVKVVPKVAPERLGAPAAAGPLSVRARPEWDEVWLLETFDANLILARVLPVRVEVENRGSTPLALRKLKFEVVDAREREFDHLKPDKARGRIEDYYGITVQSKIGRKLYREDFRANTLDTETDLAPGESRQGFVFFEIPEDVHGPETASMRVTSKRDKVAVTTRLDPTAPR